MRKTPSIQLAEVRLGRSIEEALRDLYVSRGYNYSQIARAIGLNRETVRLLVIDLGLREQRPPAEEAIA